MESRLIIKEMSLHNFKSYAGTKVIGPFHKSFSSVVGPNGSGKSNVIDALLFVFGKRASKIRLKKISELIHRSADYPNLGECHVTVEFCEIIDQGETFTVVEGSTLMVRRTADKAGTSNYYVNDKKSSFTEVQTLLKSKGIDLNNNRFLILQGEVEQIAMMKPKGATQHEAGLLEYLEDIIGSNVFISDIEESYQECEKMNELRQAKVNRVKVVENEKSGLEEAKEEAEQFLEINHNLALKQSILYQKNLLESNIDYKNAQEAAAQVENELLGEREEMKESTKSLEILEVNFHKKKAEFEETSKTMEVISAEFNSVERKDIQCREDMKHEVAKEKKFTTKLSKLEKSVIDMNKEQETKSKYETKLQGDIIALEEVKTNEQAELDSIFESLKGKTGHLREAMEEKQKTLIPLKQTVNETRQQLDVVTSELKMLRDREAKDASDKEKSQSELLRLQSELKSTIKNLSSAKNEFSVAENEIKDLQNRITDVNNKETSAQQERQSLLGKYEEIKSSLEQSHHQGAVLSALLSANKQGKLKGVRTRLGDLGCIDPKYDVAISTACGALNNVVVDNTSNGQRCVEYLRQKKLGRATFILQDQIDKKWPMPKSIQTPENAPRLYDLVDTKDEYKKAFYFSLRDTLVANDLTQAVRISDSNNKRWRVVTLAGELIDTSGAMSGGGKQVRRGLMASSKAKRSASSSKDVVNADYTNDDLNKVQMKVKEIQQYIIQLQNEKKSLMEMLKPSQKKFNTVQMTMKKMDMAMQGLERQIEEQEAVVKRVSAQKSVSTSDIKRMSELSKKESSCQKNLDNANKNTITLESEIEKLQAAIMDAGGAKLRIQKSKVDQLNAQLDEFNKEITKIQVWLSNKTKRESKCELEISSTQALISECKTALDELKAEQANIEEIAQEVLIRYEEEKSLLKSRDEELHDIQSTYEEKKVLVDELRSKEVSLVNKFDDLTRQLKEKEKKVHYWDNKLLHVKKTIDQALIPKSNNTEENKEENKDEEDNNNTNNNDVKPQQTIINASKRILEPFVEFSEDELNLISQKDIEYSITMLEKQLSSLQPNMAAINEYYQKEMEYLARVKQLDETTQARDEARQKYDSLRKQRLDAFMTGFSLISMKLKEMYQMLTLGGDAELELVDSLDPFSEGVVFSVRPPKKSWKNIQNLSGGEKTLSSLALVFALHHYKPTPLYVMDEIDAALDFKNVSIVANYIKERTKDAQFIIISLRNNMFELADRLVGIYKTNDQTKSITIDPAKFEMPKGKVARANIENTDPQTMQTTTSSSTK